jgi:predicted Rossmann fold nucleotide-binding protein DprA/Smf involved in DNA uptake
MPDLWTMPTTPPARVRQPKPDKLAMHDPDKLRRLMAASVDQENRKGRRGPPPAGNGAYRNATTADQIMEMLDEPMSANRISTILGKRRETPYNALLSLEKQGKVKREKRNHEYYWSRVEE